MRMFLFAVGLIVGYAIGSALILIIVIKKEEKEYEQTRINCDKSR